MHGWVLKRAKKSWNVGGTRQLKFNFANDRATLLGQAKCLQHVVKADAAKQVSSAEAAPPFGSASSEGEIIGVLRVLAVGRGWVPDPRCKIVHIRSVKKGSRSVDAVQQSVDTVRSR